MCYHLTLWTLLNNALIDRYFLHRIQWLIFRFSDQQINFLIFMKIVKVILSKLRASNQSGYPDYKLRQVSYFQLWCIRFIQLIQVLCFLCYRKALGAFVCEREQSGSQKMHATKKQYLFACWCDRLLCCLICPLRLAKATLTLIPLFGIHEIIFIFATDEQTTGTLRYIKVFVTLFLNSFEVGSFGTRKWARKLAVVNISDTVKNCNYQNMQCVPVWLSSWQYFFKIGPLHRAFWWLCFTAMPIKRFVVSSYIIISCFYST